MSVTFVSCLDPVPHEEFVSRYLGKSPVKFPGASSRFADLLTPDEIENALARLWVYDGMIRLVTASGDVDPSKYLFAPGGTVPNTRQINPIALKDCMLAGATLGLLGAESQFPRVAELCKSIEESLFASVSALLVVSLTRDKPSSVHWDAPDMFVCQIRGRKRWPIFEPIVKYPLQDGAYNRNEGADRPVAQDEVLEQGDALYVPGGWPHQPASIDDLSIHLAFSLARPTGVDLLRFIVDIVSQQEFARSALPLHGTQRDREVYVDTLKRLVEQSLNEDVAESYCVAQRLWAQSERPSLLK